MPVRIEAAVKAPGALVISVPILPIEHGLVVLGGLRVGAAGDGLDVKLTFAHGFLLLRWALRRRCDALS
jgi:hypothetical protein